jgi:hypothetical protein
LSGTLLKITYDTPQHVAQNDISVGGIIRLAGNRKSLIRIISDKANSLTMDFAYAPALWQGSDYSGTCWKQGMT